MTDRTEQKVCDIMETYLGGNPDILKAIEFLCLAEGGEVTHNRLDDGKVRNIKIDTTEELLLHSF